MDNIIRNLVRLGIIGFYPLCIFTLFLLLFRNEHFYNSFKKNIKKILINTSIISLITIVGLLVFFSFEEMIYSYDYAGHWVRALEIRDLFFTNPLEIFPKLYTSMNYSDYSYLPSVFLLPITIINTSYTFFSIGSFIMFIIPTIVLLQCIYFCFFNKYSYMPILIYLMFYPLYYGLFYGEIDCCGLFFVVYSIYILFLTPITKIKKYDVLSINLTSFMLIFLRRYYLFYVAVMYVLFLVRSIIAFYKDKNYKVLINALLSGIFALAIMLIFFMPFVLKVLTNNYSEVYEVYNRDNKIFALFNYFSYIIVVICIYSIILLYKSKKYTINYILSFIILICFIFWRTQAFEYHHYNLILIPALFIFSYGFYNVFSNKRYLGIFLSIILIFQSANIYLNIIPNNIPIFTSLRKQPEKFWGVNEFKDLSIYLNSLTQGEGQTIFMATGSSIFNYDLIQNANLPDISSRPKFETKTFDLRDGLPRDLEHIKYILISDPIQYINKDYQHMYDVITNAILYEDQISNIYNLIYTTKIDDINVMVYEKIGDFSPSIKQYFYGEMIKYYPDKQDYFSYILN